jgi:hypothetical protein
MCGFVTMRGRVSPPLDQPLSRRVYGRRDVANDVQYFRSDLKPARTSCEKSSGCSHAAKWPPLSSLL